EPVLDLLGDPWVEPKSHRGRRPVVWNALVAEKIAFLVATGSTQGEIAARFNVDVKTLRKNYSRELKQGRTLARQVLIEAAAAKAVGGSAPHLKIVLAELSKGDVRAFEEKVERGGVRQRHLGKKEAADLAAQSAGRNSEWGDDLVGPPTVQ
ncbi:MAG: hypothetical protein U1C74_34285, partial [Phenylobacterium sp.]|nr:hypothetical protein [Phenylobacterium sp.]